MRFCTLRIEAVLRRPVACGLCALIRVNERITWRSLRQRLHHRVEYQFAMNGLACSSANDSSRKQVYDDDEIQSALPSAKWSERPGVVELFPGRPSPNRTCTSQRIRLSIQVLLNAKPTSASRHVARLL